MAEVEKHLPNKPLRFPIESCEQRPSAVQGSHVGVHPQKQQGKYYVGVIAPAARFRADQLRGLAAIASEYGSSDLRLTVWQSILIPDVNESDLPAVRRRIEEAGLSWSATSIRAGLVACTGNGGCKFAVSDTKRHCVQIGDHLDARIKLDVPINIHLTGCPNSCAQHYIGDIGLLGCRIGEAAIEGYHLYVGGGYGERQNLGREICRDIPADEVPRVIERMLDHYMQKRLSDSEAFVDFVRRHPAEKLKEMFDNSQTEVAW
jgi:ferredoxin-nitrite reductase